MKAENLYQLLPRYLQDIVVNIYGYKLSKQRYSSEYKKIEEQIFARDLWNEEQLGVYLDGKIREIVNFAFRYVPYYQKLFSELSIQPEDIKSAGDLTNALPILTKDVVQNRVHEFYPECLSELNYFNVKTSGTTGKGLVFPMTLDADRKQWATWWRYRSRFGLDRNTWYAHFYGKSIVPFDQVKPPFWRVNYPGRQILFSAYHIQKDNLPYYVDALNKYQPPWIQGYPSLLNIIAEYILQTNSLEYTPKIVTIGSESLLAHQKQKIESAFNAKCRQHYGLTEATASISECPEGNLHVDEDFGYAEFIENQYGCNEIVSTGFTNKAFVLLRYNTGDVATLPKAPAPRCPCGRAGRLVNDIDGRIEDYVVTQDGRRIGRLDHIVKDMVNIKECQIVQEKLNQIVIKIIKGPNYTAADEDKLIVETKKRVGYEMDITPDYVDALQRSKTGKLRFVISKI